MQRLFRPISRLTSSANHHATPPSRVAHFCVCSMPKRKAGTTLEELYLSQGSFVQKRKMATAPTETTSISLTEKESQLKDLLLDVAKSIDQADANAEPVVLRWAGGWVRDKLLGTESVDIDTAINTMTGETFAIKLCKHCQDPTTIEKFGISATDIGNLHKIAKNPDKSKHLETTTIKLFGYDVDFVNLRKETYTEDSRNPQMEFGTAEEDALRRDATVNALFYNLNTGKVEDFTTGLADMRKRVMRTPLDPYQTFMDDPLRVLRLVRFASRLEFTIDSDVEQLMGDSRVLEALRAKISRERVGIELEKMLKGKHPRESLEYIERLGLYHAIFTDPAEEKAAKPDISKWRVAYGLLDFLAARKTPGSIYDVLVHHEEAIYYAWTLAALVPWESVPACDTTPPPPSTPPAAAEPIPEKPSKKSKTKAPPPPKARPAPVVLAAREGIKTPSRFCDLVAAAHNNLPEIMALKADVVNQVRPRIEERDTFGMAIRRWDARGGFWRLQVLYAILVEAVSVLPLSPTTTSSSSSSAAAAASREQGKEEDEEEESPSEKQTREKFLTEWQLFLDHLGPDKLDVMDAPGLKRLIDGTQLAKTLGVKPDKWMTAALDVCVAWQLRHPEADSPEGAVEEVRKRKTELGIP